MKRVPFLASPRTFLPLAALVFLSSCGPATKREFSEETGLRIRIDEFIKETEDLAANFSYSQDPIEIATPLDPPPTPENSLLLSSKELGSITSNVPLTTDDYLGLGTTYGIGGQLQSSYRLEPIEEGWSERIESILGVRYLFVYWTPSYEAPRIIDESTYDGGRATVVVSLFDRETRTWPFRFSVESSATGQVEATAKEHKLAENLIFEINQLLRSGLLDQIYARIESSCGGSLRKGSADSSLEVSPALDATSLQMEPEE